MFEHAEVEGEQRGLYSVGAQPDVAEWAKSLVSRGSGVTVRPANSVAKRWWAGVRSGNRDQGRALRLFCVRLSEFEVLQVIRVIHRLFSIAYSVAPAEYPVLPVLQTNVSCRRKK